MRRPPRPRAPMRPPAAHKSSERSAAREVPALPAANAPSAQRLRPLPPPRANTNPPPLRSSSPSGNIRIRSGKPLPPSKPPLLRHRRPRLPGRCLPFPRSHSPRCPPPSRPQSRLQWSLRRSSLRRRSSTFCLRQTRSALPCTGAIRDRPPTEPRLPESFRPAPGARRIAAIARNSGPSRGPSREPSREPNREPNRGPREVTKAANRGVTSVRSRGIPPHRGITSGSRPPSPPRQRPEVSSHGSRASSAASRQRSRPRPNSGPMASNSIAAAAVAAGAAATEKASRARVDRPARATSRTFAEAGRISGGPTAMEVASGTASAGAGIAAAAAAIGAIRAPRAGRAAAPSEDLAQQFRRTAASLNLGWRLFALRSNRA